MMMLDWEDADDDCDRVEEDWFCHFPDDRNAGRRIAVLEPLMKRDDISDDCKKVLWFANFLFIYYFCLCG